MSLSKQEFLDQVAARLQGVEPINPDTATAPDPLGRANVAVLARVPPRGRSSSGRILASLHPGTGESLRRLMM